MNIPLVYAVGETVFDIIFKDYQTQAAKPGGSAFNAMISLGRLDVPCQFISDVGTDKLGHYIKDFLRKNEVGNEYVLMTKGGKTSLALAFLNDDSDAEYDFYKDYPNQKLNGTIPAFTSSDYLLFGSFYGLNPTLRPQIESLLEGANANGSLVFYDPNFRSSHLDDLEELRDTIELNIQASTIVRASDEDMRNIYGVSTFDEARKKVLPFCDYFVYTANANGIDLATPEFNLHIDVDQIKPLSTIGAGDTFNAGIIYGLYQEGIATDNLRSLSKDSWSEILSTAASFSKEVCMSYENYISTEFANSYKNAF